MRKYKSAADKRARAEHAQWLKKQGIRPSNKSRSQLCGVPIKPDLAYRRPDLPDTSDSLEYQEDATMARTRDAGYQEAVEERAKTVAPSFNKGPLQPQTNADLFTSRRRS